MEYSFIPFDIINNPTCKFYKVLIDGVCQFDEFIERLDRMTSAKRDFDNLLAWLEDFNYKTIYPKERLNIIRGVARDDVREFKKGTIRIYVILQRTEVYIIRGGLKTEQKNDIKLLNKETKKFPS